MKALTIRQPFAWSIFFAGKEVENRDWHTHIRGTVAIHAARTMTHSKYNQFCNFYRSLQSTESSQKAPAFDELIRGAIIGFVDIVDCVTESDSLWFEGKYGFVLKNPRPLIEPIFCKGALSFWTLPHEIQQMLKSSTHLER